MRRLLPLVLVIAAALLAAAPGGARAALSLPGPQRAALHRLLRGLPRADTKLIEQGLARARAGLVRRLLRRLERLKAARRRGMLTALRDGLAPLAPAQRRAVIDGLLGLARSRERRTLAGLAGSAEQQILALARRDMESLAVFLPAQLGYPEDPRDVPFIDQVFGLMQANVASLLGNALAPVPAAVRTLLAEADLGGLQALQGVAGGPPSVGLNVLILQSPQAEQFVQQAGYQAGQDCVNEGGCTPFDNFVNEISGVRVMPQIIQRAYVDCVEGPVCTRADLDGVVRWIRLNIAASQQQQALVNMIVDAFQADTETIQENWTLAYYCVGDPSYPACR